MSSIWTEIIRMYLEEDSDISEIQANGTSSLFVKRNGLRIEVPKVFPSEMVYSESIKELVKKIKPSYDGVSELNFLEEGRLTLANNGIARVHIVLPPASDSPQVTIAKKTTSLTTLDKIYSSGSLSEKMRNFIKAIVAAKCNIVFSGSTGSGKTTFLESVTKLIPNQTRIGIVEDSPELRLTQPNVTYLHSKPWKPGMDPNEEVTLDWCTRQINRMRTDVLIIGESRGKEFKEFITAANSGMEGSMTTLHANNPKMALMKMTQFVMEAQPQPVRTINTSIANTIDIIIQLHKTIDGQYKCIAIEEVSNILGRDENAEIATNTLSSYDEATGLWTDTFLISDKLRKKIENAGFEATNFTEHSSGRGGLRSFSSRRQING